MERVSRLGEVATANTLARLLSTIPTCSKGPAQICIFDIHALQNQFYFKVRLGTDTRQAGGLPSRGSEGRESRDEDGRAAAEGGADFSPFPLLLVPVCVVCALSVCVSRTPC